MENGFYLTDDLLWDYADDLLSTTEREQVVLFLQQHPEQMARLEAIQAEKQNWSNIPVDKAQTGFADRVMAAWVAEQAHARVLVHRPDWVLRAIMGAFGVFLLLAVGLMARLAPSVSAPVMLPTEYVPVVPAVDWLAIAQNSLLHYAFLLGLGVTALKILDKYLQQRNEVPGALSGQ
jgi:anti-sigma factor RsiW